MVDNRWRGVRRPQVAPTYPVEIDWGHPLSQGLIGLWIPTVGPADQAGDLLLSTTGGGPSPITATSRGPAWGQVTGDTGLRATAPAPFTTGSTFSLFWRGAILGNFVGSFNAPVVGVTYANTDTNPFISYDIEITGGENIYGRVQNTQSASVQNGIGELSAGLTVGAFGLNFYHNGGFSSNAAAPAPLFSATSQVVIGCYPGDLTRSPNIATSIAAFYNVANDRAVGSSALMRWLHEEPFAMLRPVVRRTYAIPSRAVDLAPGSGTVSLAGLAPALDVGVNLAPAAGAVLISGLAPDLSVGTSLTPGAGALLMPGLAPALEGAAPPIYPYAGAGVADVWMASADAAPATDPTELDPTITDVWMARASIVAPDAAGIVGMPIINAPNSPYPEGTTPIMQMVIRDPYGNGIPASAFSSLTLTLADTLTGAIVNSVSQVSILNTGRGTIDASGNLQIILEVGDTSLSEAPGQSQVQRSAIIDFTYATSGAQASSGTGRQQVNFIIQALAGP